MPKNYSKGSKKTGAKKKKIQENQLVNTVDDLFTQINGHVEDAKNDSGTWRDRQDKWHRLRMRIKKNKTFPFPGCANMRMPTAEIKIRKLKSALVKVIFGIRPIVQAIPSPKGNLQTAQKIEKFLDHLIMNKMEYKPKGIITIDQSIEKGFFLNKPYWRKEIITRVESIKLDDLSSQEKQALAQPDITSEQLFQMVQTHFDVDMQDDVYNDNVEAINEVVNDIQEGKDEGTYSFKDLTYDCPDVALASPEYVYVPADSGYNPQDCRMITHEYYLPYDTVVANTTNGKDWSVETLNEIDTIKSQAVDTLTEYSKETREGVDRINNNPSKLVRIWDTYMYYDINGDGVPEKCEVISAPDFHKIFKKLPVVSYSNKFPFVKFFYELGDDRWFHHRGLCELIEDLVKEIDTQHNQKLDVQTMRNTPMITYRAGMVNPNLIKAVPTQAIPRHDKDDISIMNNTNLNAEFSYEKEQMILESKIEELVGQIDFTLQSMINKRQPRTLGEVDHQVQSQQVVFSLDAELYTMSFSELFNQIWELWCQYGKDEYEFAYFGADGWEPLKLTKEEIQGKYSIIVRGNDQNYNPQARQAKAEFILNAMMNPVAAQMGVVQPVNIYNAYKKLFQVIDESDWQGLITDPSQAPPPPPPPPDVKIDMEHLTPAEQVQVKATQNIKPDPQGMMLQKKEELTQSMAEGVSNARADRPDTK